MTLSLRHPFPPMEAMSVDEIPEGKNWQYEPKWDGFHCLVFRDGDKVELRSKSGKPLGRYFPEIVETFGETKLDQYVIDGELLIARGKVFSFDALQMRLHPAESRIRKLAIETPASFAAFDLLVDADGTSLIDQPLKKRRIALERLVPKLGSDGISLSPATTNRATASKWLRHGGAKLDGVIAKR